MTINNLRITGCYFVNFPVDMISVFSIFYIFQSIAGLYKLASEIIVTPYRRPKTSLNQDAKPTQKQKQLLKLLPVKQK